MHSSTGTLEVGINESKEGSSKNYLATFVSMKLYTEKRSMRMIPIPKLQFVFDPLLFPFGTPVSKKGVCS